MNANKKILKIFCILLRHWVDRPEKTRDDKIRIRLRKPSWVMNKSSSSVLIAPIYFFSYWNKSFADDPMKNNVLSLK